MITSHSKEQHADAIANYMPGGTLWAAKGSGGTVLRQFIEGLACESQFAETLLKAYQDNFLPDTTVNFIEEWERVVGIPDDCFSNVEPAEVGLDPLDIRRAQILVKLAAMSVQTVEDFERVAEVFGIDVTVYPGIESGLVLPINELRFTIVIEYVYTAPFLFPFTFPIQFGSATLIILSCLYNKIKPANCQVIFTETS